GKVTFAKVDGEWKMTEPVAADAERAALQEFVKGFAELRAAQLVAEKSADLKQYGLTHTEPNWQLFHDGKEVLALFVGDREKDGKRVYARLGKSDLVVLLDDKLSGQVAGEYRSRKVWPALDAFQVEGLTYAYDKSSFTLQKK